MDQLFKLITIEGLPQTGKTTMAYERALSPYYKDSAIVVVSATQDTARDAKRRFALRLQNIASDKSITLDRDIQFLSAPYLAGAPDHVYEMTRLFIMDSIDHMSWNAAARIIETAKKMAKGYNLPKDVIVIRTTLPN